MSEEEKIETYINTSTATVKDKKERLSGKSSSGYYPMLHNTATDTLASLAGTMLEENVLTGRRGASRTTERTGAEVSISFSSESSVMRISTEKLLNMAMVMFTENSHIDTSIRKREIRGLRVRFSVEEYALLLGEDVMKRVTSTPEEEAEETKRRRNILDRVKKSIKKDIETLMDCKLDYKGSNGDFSINRIISGGGVKGGYVEIEFSLSMAEVMIKNPITQLPKAIFAIDERKPNAYKICRKMGKHYANDNNVKQGTNKSLKVKTLLDATEIPKIEKVKAQRGSWEQKIKEPLENALDELTNLVANEGKYLAHWEYRKKSDEPIEEDGELLNLVSNYDTWANLIIYFIPEEEIENAERIQRKDERRKEEAKNSAKRKSTRKKKEQ